MCGLTLLPPLAAGWRPVGGRLARLPEAVRRQHHRTPGDSHVPHYHIARALADARPPPESSSRRVVDATTRRTHARVRRQERRRSMNTTATGLTKCRRLLPWRLSLACWVIAIGVLMLGFGVAPAGAASLVYLDAASNVWVASPDGAITRQLTSDANPDSLYLSPSMQDDGTVVVPNQDGLTRVLNADGTKKSGPWSKPTPSLFNTALNWADAAATGSFYLAAQYTAPFGGGADPTVSLAALNAPGTSSCVVFVCLYDLVRPRFIPGTHDYTAITDGGDPVSYNGDFVRVVKADGTVVDWLGFTGPGTPDSDIRNVDVSRTGDRILVEITPKGITTSSSLTVLESTGPPPGGTISQPALCSLDRFAAGDARPRFSPDATQISFTEPDGLHIASAPTAGPNGTVCSRTTISSSPAPATPTGARTPSRRPHRLAVRQPGPVQRPHAARSASPPARPRRRARVLAAPPTRRASLCRTVPVQARPAWPASAARPASSTSARCVIAQRSPATTRTHADAAPVAARTRSDLQALTQAHPLTRREPTIRTPTHDPHQNHCSYVPSQHSRGSRRPRIGDQTAL